jgi:transglutaminase-like putative cysteine protease
MLRPRNGGGQKLLKSEINITPAPLRLTWSRDIFGNHVAIARFDDRSDELRFVNNIRLDHAPISFNEADIEESARFYPFACAAEDWPELKRFTRPLAARNEIDRWSASFFREDRSMGTHEFLVGLTNAISRGFKHVSRHQKGIQDPVRTLELGSGSCRDLAVLMIAALRSRGFAARFVSAYVHLADDAVPNRLFRRKAIKPRARFLPCHRCFSVAPASQQALPGLTRSAISEASSGPGMSAS